MRILVRITRFAVWSARLAWFALPLLVLAVFSHRAGAISSQVFEICLGLAAGLGLAAVLLGIMAWIRLWFTGDRGWGRAGFGMAMGAIPAVPALYAAAMIALYPSTADISTDPRDPPPLMVAETEGAVLGPEDFGRRFPHLAPRSYQIAPEALLSLALAQARWRNWQVIGEIDPSATRPGALHAVETTLFGWRNEIALRIRPEPGGARIALRAASVYPPLHDLGFNARLAESFLLTLDDQVTVFVREGLADLEEVDEEDLVDLLIEEESEEPL